MFWNTGDVHYSRKDHKCYFTSVSKTGTRDLVVLKQKPRHKLLPSLIQNDFPKVHNIDRDINH